MKKKKSVKKATPKTHIDIKSLMNTLASIVAKMEGKKHSASIGDVREILGIVSELMAVSDMMGDKPNLASLLVANGYGRMGKKSATFKIAKVKANI